MERDHADERALSSQDQFLVALLPVLRRASTHEISGALHLSGHTVKDYVKSIFDKTGVRSREGAGRAIA